MAEGARASELVALVIVAALSYPAGAPAGRSCPQSRVCYIPPSPGRGVFEPFVPGCARAAAAASNPIGADRTRWPGNASALSAIHR